MKEGDKELKFSGRWVDNRRQLAEITDSDGKKRTYLMLPLTLQLERDLSDEKKQLIKEGVSAHVGYADIMVAIFQQYRDSCILHDESDLSPAVRRIMETLLAGRHRK